MPDVHPQNSKKVSLSFLNNFLEKLINLRFRGFRNNRRHTFQPEHLVMSQCIHEANNVVAKALTGCTAARK